MNNYRISRHGLKQTLVNFTGLPQSTVSDWMCRPAHPNYELCQKMMDELVAAQAKVVEKWSQNKRMQAAIANTRTRKPRK